MNHADAIGETTEPIQECEGVPSRSNAVGDMKSPCTEVVCNRAHICLLELRLHEFADWLAACDDSLNVPGNSGLQTKLSNIEQRVHDRRQDVFAGYRSRSRFSGDPVGASHDQTGF